MDSAEDDENSIQCDVSKNCDLPIESISDAEVQSSLKTNSREIEELETAFQENFSNINMKLPMTVQNCLPQGLQVSSELVVITNTGQKLSLIDFSRTGFINDQKLPINAFHPTDGSEPLTKRLCIEQDGQTYILALQDNLEGFSNIMELQPKNFSAVDASQLLAYQESNNIQSKDGINQNWFTSREEKVTLHNKGHIWKQGMWAKEEIELLENNIELYCKEHNISNPATIVFKMAKDERKDFYRTIAKGLNRPLFSVYRRVVRMYDNKNHVGKYTTEELEKLKKLRSVYGNDWQAIGSVMGRSASSIKDRCRLMKDNCNQGKWLPAEERRLAEAVYELANALPGEMISSGLSWAIVADRVGTRSEKQCRTKWLNYLNWKVAGGTEWTREDDITLICRVYAFNVSDENDVDWSELSKGWLSVRSPQWLRGKWWTLKRHVPRSNDISFPEVCDYLYQQFVLKQKEDLSLSNALTGSIDIHTVLNHSKPLLQPIALPSTPPPIVISSTQVCSSSVVSLTTAQCMDMVNPSATLASVPVGSVLQTVLPQNIQLAANPQTFVLTTPSQQALPIQTSLPTNQIIIQTMAPNDLQTSKNSTIEMNSQIINPSNSSTLTSLASTQIPSAPPSPTADVDVLDESVEDSSTIINTYTVEVIDETSSIHPETDIEIATQGSNKSNHLILSDPMLGANGSPEATHSDMESEKHITEDNLVDVHR